MRVFLLHGMARTPASMLVLAARLRRAGYPVALFGYSVSVETLEAIVDRFVERVRREVAAGEEYAVVGHSLGNVVTRLASPRLASGFARFIMLAPPNGPAKSAWMLRRNPLFRALTRDTGQHLGDPEFFAALPRPTVPSLVIAGTAGPRKRWLPLGDEPNDGIVTLEEARLDGVPCIEIPALHTWLMNRHDVFVVIHRFLQEPTAFRGDAVGSSDSLRKAAS